MLLADNAAVCPPMFYAGEQLSELHIYECPFYYIDYCLSTMAALQFFLLSLDDHKAACLLYTSPTLAQMEQPEADFPLL